MKRFYTDVSARPSETEGQFAVFLDERPVRTPQKNSLLVPTQALAEAIAAEWDAQAEERVDIHAMPLTRHVCTALDRIVAHREMTVAEIANYARTDLLCYRANSPQSLVERQAAAWQPVLDWLADALNAKLEVTTGIDHVEQSVVSIDNIKADLQKLSDIELAALHTLAAGMGSVALAMAVAHGHITADEAYEKSIIDEMFQTEHWGDDPDWQARRAALKDVIVSAETLLGLVR